MEPQEIFNQAYVAVMHQGCKSLNYNRGCQYRGPDGLKCAIGHLIDDATAKAWDRRSANDIASIARARNVKYKVPDWILKNFTLVADIQAAHDRVEPNFGLAFITAFKGRMERVAQDHNLTVPDLEEN